MIKNIINKLFGSEKKQDSTILQGNVPGQSSVKPHESLVYEGTPDIKKLLTRGTPKQILSEDFPKHQ